MAQKFFNEMVNPFQEFYFDFQNRPPRPYIAIARLAAPPFFFFEKVGGEILVLFLALLDASYFSFSIRPFNPFALSCLIFPIFVPQNFYHASFSYLR